MTELYDTDRVKDNPEYWEAFAERVTRTALAEARGGSGVLAFTNARQALIAATLLVVAAAGAVFGSRPLSVAPADEVSEALQPSDAVGRTMTAASTPPALGALLLSEYGRGEIR